jgi:hypothetical protein
MRADIDAYGDFRAKHVRFHPPVAGVPGHGAIARDRPCPVHSRLSYRRSRQKTCVEFFNTGACFKKATPRDGRADAASVTRDGAWKTREKRVASAFWSIARMILAGLEVVRPRQFNAVGEIGFSWAYPKENGAHLQGVHN